MIGQQLIDSWSETNCLASRFLPTDEIYLAFTDKFALGLLLTRDETRHSVVTADFYSKGRLQK